MRILYVTDTFAVCGGIERVLTDKMNSLSKLFNYDVYLLTIYQGSHSFPFTLNEGIHHVDVGVRLNQQYEYRGLLRLLKRRQLSKTIKSRLKSVINDLQPDVIVSVKLDFVGVLLSVKGHIPMAVESHTLCHAEKLEGAGIFRRVHFWKIKRDIRNVEALIALTEGDANDWRELNSNVYVIPNIVHLNENNTYSSCVLKSVVFVGRLSKQKNIGGLLDVWERIYLRNPEWELHVYGEKGDIEESVYNRLLAAQKIGIVIHNPVKEHMLEEYRHHSVLVLTSVFEPFGLVLPEAMSCGVPVVSYDSPYGPASIISDAEDGFLIPYNNEDLFVERLCQLMTDTSLRQKMGKRAIVSSRRYAEDSIMPLWKKLFEELINKNPNLC